MFDRSSDPHAGQPVRLAGAPLGQARAALVMVHGRGASAASILELAGELPGAGLAYLAPQAAQNTWYPHGFMEDMARNQPWLASALAALGRTIDQARAAGIPTERIAVLGFSQGACLASEYVARHAQRMGGVIALSGGLIGPAATPRDYPGSLDGTPVFLGCSDVDGHIPAARVRETAAVFERMGGLVDARLYPGMGHTVNADEIAAAQAILDRMLAPTTTPRPPQ